jgi:hypothetical protein
MVGFAVPFLTAAGILYRLLLLFPLICLVQALRRKLSLVGIVDVKTSLERL